MTTDRQSPIHGQARADAAACRAGRMGRREFLTRATALGVSAGMAYGLIGAAAPAMAQEAAPSGAVLRVQMDVRPIGDPRLWDWPQIANVARGWLEYLAEYQPDGTIRPMLLERWEVSEDARTYTLHVRPGVTWSNGDALTAAHVAHNIRRWCESDVPGNSMASRMGEMVDREAGRIRDGVIEEIDALTLRLSLPAPDIALIASVTDYPAAIVHPSYGGGQMTEPGAQVGTGPYSLAVHTLRQRAELVRREDHDWWGAEVEGFGGATLERIVFLDYGPDPAQWLRAIQRDEVDLLYESVGGFVEVLDQLTLVRSEALTANTIVIRGNQRAEIDGRTPYADRRVRQALQLASENGVLLELGYAGLGEIAENFHVSPLHPEYAPIEGATRYDPAAALALMEEAGLTDFEHELVSADDDWRKKTADAAAALLRDAGIAVRRKLLSQPEFSQVWTTLPLSVTDWNQRPLGVQVLALAYRSGGAWNETGYANPAFDAKLAEAMGVLDVAARRALMADLERMLLDDGVIVQPYWRVLVRHYRESVTGAEMHPSFELRPYALGIRSA